jgi:catechol 2,3-dioxygenase-like lactoylglutathione lyase family enzyme
MSQATATKPSVITDAPIHPSLATKDLARARTWYADNVGWEPVLEPPGTLVYKVGQSFFTVYESEFAGTAKNTVMNWIVPDLRAQVARLRERGVTFEEYDFGDFKTVDGIMTTPDGNGNAWFKDADGNIVGVIQDPAAPADGLIATMIAAADLARAKAWYADKLGFQPTQEFEEIVVNYMSGGSTFSVYKTEFAGTAKNTVGVWRLEGVRPEVDRLKGRGVVFEDYDFGAEGRTVEGVLSDEQGNVIAWFKDSEGNILGLTEDNGEMPS